MKGIRITLSFLAFCISIGGSVASSVLLQNTVYLFVDLPGAEDDACNPIQANCSVGAFPCKVSGVTSVLRSSSVVATQCGLELHLP